MIGSITIKDIRFIVFSLQAEWKIAIKPKTKRKIPKIIATEFFVVYSGDANLGIENF